MERPIQCQWRSKTDPHNIQLRTAKSAAEVPDLFTEAFAADPTDISISEEPPPIKGRVPYADIVEGLQQGNVIPFLGAGVPLSARRPGERWTPQCDFLPSGVELARYLAKRSGMPVWHLRDTDNLARVASYFEVANKRVTIAQELGTIFTKGKPTETHKLLASLPEDLGHPLLIVSTNYDLLMETALKGIKYDRVIHCGQLENKCSVLLWKFEWAEPKPVTEEELADKIDLSTRTVLYKMHGSIDTPVAPDPDLERRNNRFVITEEHYVDFLSRINASPPAVPNIFKTFFETRSFLFVGYSLDDWNLRVILHSLQDVLTRRSSSGSRLARMLGFAGQGHWAIQKDPTEYDEAVWEARNVTIGNRDLNQFVREMLDPTIGLKAQCKKT
jgi:hypothetical protein